MDVTAVDHLGDVERISVDGVAPPRDEIVPNVVAPAPNPPVRVAAHSPPDRHTATPADNKIPRCTLFPQPFAPRYTR